MRQRINSRLKLIALIHTGITSNRANIDHAVAELDESTTLLRKFNLGYVSQTEVRQLLVFLLSKPLDEAVTRERLTQAVCN